LLKQGTTDPCDGAPLRHRLPDDRVVIDSVAPDRQDKGGTFDSKGGTTKGTDLGITMGNVAQRRLLQLPLAPVSFESRCIMTVFATPLRTPTCSQGCVPDSRCIDAGSTHEQARIQAPVNSGQSLEPLVGANQAAPLFPWPNTRRCR
jgi:hypothetical protein